MDTKNTKQKILDLATSLLREKGYHGWSYEDISQEVGIKKASIHYYFPKKSDLVLEALRLYIQKFSVATEQIMQNGQSSRERLEQYLDLYKMAFNLKDMLCLCISLAADCRTIPSAIGDRIASFFITQRGFLKGIIDDGIAMGEFKSIVSSAVYADLILNCLQGLLLRGRLERDGLSFSSNAKLLLDLLK